MNGYSPTCHAKTIAISEATNTLTKERLQNAYHQPAIFHFRKNGTYRSFCSLKCANKI